ncbi:hypothetical protein QVD17_20857 [Tagetes erecta]|uniref:Uncharacterized protein n=1 Tax=Tagetes erecta TaxID=13708 RepID=A0AAD8NRD5_TARER|nr:hypothetical protein QVD17_20857 [Tagetes erecta]
MTNNKRKSSSSSNNNVDLAFAKLPAKRMKRIKEENEELASTTTAIPLNRIKPPSPSHRTPKSSTQKAI